MRNSILAVGLVALLIGCTPPQKKGLTVSKTIEQGLLYCESTIPYNGGILIANFGSDELNPLNQEGRGYIAYYKSDSVSTFIREGYLNAPKGMTISNNLLFVADVGKVLIFNLNDVVETPAEILLPEGNDYVNDLTYGENRLYISVTNSGNIFTLDLTNRDSLSTLTPQLFCPVPGANGLLLRGKTLYIASYPADGTVTSENCIYKISDIDKPEAEKLLAQPGLYDGLAISPEGDKLYYTDWQENAIGMVDLNSGTNEILRTDKLLTGPADLSLVNNQLIVPYLASSKVVVYNL